MATTTLHLDLTVTYDLNGEDPGMMKDMLHQMVFRAIGNGLLTGDTDAEVDEYSMAVTTSPDDQLDVLRLLTTHKLSLEHSPSGKAVDIVAPDGRCLTADANDPDDIRRTIEEAAAYVARQQER